MLGIICFPDICHRINMRQFISPLAGLLFITSCTSPAPEEQERPPDAISFFGEPLFSADPDSALVARYLEKKASFDADPDNADNIIWYGRFKAYTGDYAGAIEVYSQGIELYPEDARLYRHRGHRYISTRRLDAATADFEMAVDLIEGNENEIEPDGMPNAHGIPVSSLHGNIWYHLGLAYYLNHDLENALRGFTEGLATSRNNDNVVSTTHWIYMINRRMGDEEAASQALERISGDMDIIENFAYHQLTLFYLGELSEDELTGEGAAGDAVTYGLANWYLYNDEPDRAREIFDELLARDGWASFGYLAAEADYLKYFTP